VDWGIFSLFSINLSVDYQPSRAALVTNMVQAKVVQNHSIPVVPLQLVGDMPGNIIVYLSEVLQPSAPVILPASSP